MSICFLDDLDEDGALAYYTEKFKTCPDGLRAQLPDPDSFRSKVYSLTGGRIHTINTFVFDTAIYKKTLTGFRILQNLFVALLTILFCRANLFPNWGGMRGIVSENYILRPEEG
jgi:hypothetical protein